MQAITCRIFNARLPKYFALMSIMATLAGPAGAAPASQTTTTSATTKPAPLEFVVTFSEAVQKTPYTGRVWVLCTTRARGEPRHGPEWFNPEPFASVEVKDWKPGEPLRIAADARAYPTSIAAWPAKRYRIQAVMDLAGDERRCPAAPGNGRSAVVSRKIDPQATGPIELKIQRAEPPLRFVDDERLKHVEIESKLLSNFYGRPVKMRAAVLFPKGFDPKVRTKYPTVYDIPGFGGDHRFIHWYRAQVPATEPPFVYVALDPTCSLGHHVFANSANNGPRGDALVEELIPYLEKTFPLIPDSSARFLTGHSSGGWSALWLQINYPDYFNGVWSLAPDPVDFRNFTNIDLYKPGASAYADSAGRPVFVARSGDTPTLRFMDFARMEDVLGPGGQIHSFEAVFSPRGPDGKPKPLFDRKSGAIDAEVAKAWQAYDINLVLRKRWKELGPKLQGKLHILCGAEDTFYLDGAVRLLAETLKELGSDAEVVLVPGKDHSTLPPSDEAMSRFSAMAERFKSTAPKQ